MIVGPIRFAQSRWQEIRTEWWSDGVMEWWSDGVMEWRSDGRHYWAVAYFVGIIGLCFYNITQSNCAIQWLGYVHSVYADLIKLFVFVFVFGVRSFRSLYSVQLGTYKLGAYKLTPETWVFMMWLMIKMVAGLLLILPFYSHVSGVLQTHLLYNSSLVHLAPFITRPLYIWAPGSTHPCTHWYIWALVQVIPCTSQLL